jgi:hypothetical protein
MDNYLLPLPSGALLVFAVAAVGAGDDEFAELVADHIFGDIYRNMLAAVMNSDRVADKVREDRGTA